MHKFYVIFKNQDSIEGTTTMPPEEFSRKIIEPNIDDIYTFQFWDEEDENSDFDLVDYTVPDEDKEYFETLDGRDLWEDEEKPVVYDHVVVSTSFIHREIMVFPADVNGDIIDWGELGCVPQTTSTDHATAMHTFGMFDDYEFVKVVFDNHLGCKSLWKKK